MFKFNILETFFKIYPSRSDRGFIKMRAKQFGINVH